MNYEHYYIPIEGGSLTPAILQGSTYLRPITMLEIPANNTPVSASDKTGKVYTAVIAPSGNNQYFMTSGDWDYSSGNLYESQYQWGFYAVMTVDNDLQATGMTLSAGMHNPENDVWQPYANVYFAANDLDNILEEIRDWDDSPLADGDTTKDNFGGAFADLEPFDYTQDIGFPDIDSILELNPYSNDGSPGLFTPYELSEGQLARLGKCLYSDDMFNALVQKLDGSASPIAGILRCIQLPILTNLAHGEYPIAVFGKEIYFQNLTSAALATGAHLNLSGQYRYFTRSFGSITLKEVWGTARDYTDCVTTIYMPYVGMRRIDTNQVIGHTLELRIYVDAWTGDFVYLLRSSNGDVEGKFFSSSGIIGRWSGNFAKEVPIGRIDTGRVLSNLIGVTAAAALAPATGGISLAAGIKSGEEFLTQGLQTSGNTSGNLTGVTGYMDVQDAYVMIERAVPAYPDNWRDHIGAVKNQTYLVSRLNGYTEFSEFHADDIVGYNGCTEEEAREIEKLMLSGVFLSNT